MSTTYRAVAWNPQKRRYDMVAAGLLLAFLVVFLGVQAALRPELTIETLLIRALAAAAFTLLNIILCIGPLARLDRRFLPLLYNRRHLGVMMFTLALAHGVFSIVQFHSVGTLNPLVSVLVGNARYATIAQIPFQPFGLAALLILFLMAATSHDFWLHNLTAPVWKTLHMGVYVAYALIVLHVIFGVMQGETSLLLGVDARRWRVDGLHASAASRLGKRPGSIARTESPRVDGFVDVCSVARDSRKTRGRQVSVRRARRRLSLRRPGLRDFERLSASERPARRRPHRQRLRRVPVAWVRVPARYGRVAAAVYRESADVRRARGGRTRSRSPTAASAGYTCHSPRCSMSPGGPEDVEA